MTRSTKTQEVASKTARLAAGLTDNAIRELSDKDIEAWVAAGGAGEAIDPNGRR
jgi:hypothetical protein